jgi:hypothetical protein
MNGLCSLNMNGEVVHLKFGMPACRYFMEHIAQEHIGAISIDGINETVVGYLLYGGYYNHCIIEDKKPEKKLSDFMEFIELNMDDPDVQRELVSIGECFQQSKSVQKFIEKVEGATEEIKKKLTGMRSNPSVTEN